MSEQSKSKPIDHIRLGRIVAAIWLNTTDDGKRYYTFTIDRNYNDSTGKLKTAKSYAISDAALVQIAAERAEKRIRELLTDDTKTFSSSEVELENY